MSCPGLSGLLTLGRCRQIHADDLQREDGHDRACRARADDSFSMSDPSAQPPSLSEAGQEQHKLPQPSQPGLSDKVQQFVGSLRLPGAIGAS